MKTGRLKDTILFFGLLSFIVIDLIGSIYISGKLTGNDVWSYLFDLTIDFNTWKDILNK
ncbi:hypothetical protein [Halalkalibacillus halophilus]|uniref:hypothetical protein n=1 Tax=Halalkalibacillus halophilus TaxID=392827 RepID=UPI0012EB454E|nr:hypothetical protein [Halalkalibacillus halophilus]